MRSFSWGAAGVGLVAALLMDSGAAAAVGATPSAAVPSYRCIVEQPMATPRPDRPVYALRVDIRPAELRVIGLTEVRFTPDLSTDRLVFRLWANHPVAGAPANRETVGPVTVGGEVVAARLTDATTLVVPLVGPAPVGQTIEASVSWELSLRAWKGDRISSTGFGLNAAVRLGSFFPILAWEPGRGWVLDPPIRGRTETSTTPTADFVTTVTVPDGLSVMATGVADVSDRIFTATAVRDVAVSVGRFRVATGVAHAPDAVQVVVGVHSALADDPAAYVRRVVAALENQARRFGPYPWPQYSLALTPDLVGGIEYPMHVMQGPNSIGRSTPHEVGHMWFYSLVGNDQGVDPWLDEGLATWAEVGSEGTLGAFLAKVVPAEGRGHLGDPMTYWDAHPAAYYRSVYVQGTQALASLGRPAEVDCALRDYVAANAFGIAHPVDLVRSLRKFFPGAARSLARYGVAAVT